MPNPEISYSKSYVYCDENYQGNQVTHYTDSQGNPANYNWPYLISPDFYFRMACMGNSPGYNMGIADTSDHPNPSNLTRAAPYPTGPTQYPNTLDSVGNETAAVEVPDSYSNPYPVPVYPAAPHLSWPNHGGVPYPLVSNNDVVLSMALNPAGPTGGDARVLAGIRTVPATDSSGKYYFENSWLSIPGGAENGGTASADPTNWSGSGNDTPPGGIYPFPELTNGFQRHTLGWYGNHEFAFNNGPWNLDSGGAPITTPNGSPYNSYLGQGANLNVFSWPSSSAGANAITLLQSPMAVDGWSNGALSFNGSAGGPGTLGQAGDVGVIAWGRTPQFNQANPLGSGDWTNAAGNLSDGCLIQLPEQQYQCLYNDSGTTAACPIITGTIIT